MKSVRSSLSVAARSGKGTARQPRAALARPAVLLTAMSVAVGGAVLWAGAQGGRTPVKMKSAMQGAPAQSKLVDPLRDITSKRATSLNDLPELVERYAERRASAKLVPASAVRPHGGSLDGPGLVEVDLTPNSPSDEREPILSPDGDMIAFASNGEDANGDGKLDAFNSNKKYHIWVADREGKFAYQVTGLSNRADASTNQRRPVWSPDGNILAFVDDAVTESNVTLPQVRTVRPKADSDPSTPGLQIGAALTVTTSFPGNKRSAAWSGVNDTIVFACDADLDDNNKNGQKESTGQYDLFSISASGDTRSLRRLTGGTVAPIFSTTNEWNPAFADRNPNAIFFSSNRNAAGRLTVGRRIWAMAANGSGHVLVTDPTLRTGNQANQAEALNIVDDFPNLSVEINGEELLGFQSNARVDDSDVAPDANDNNIWTIPVDSQSLVPTSTSTSDADVPRLALSVYGSGTSISVENYKLVPDLTIGEYVPSYQADLPSAGAGPEGVDIDGEYVYTARRNAGWVERHFIQTNKIAPPFGGLATARFTTGGTLKSPTGVAVYDGDLYVASGTGSIAVYRYSTITGTGRGVVGTPTDGVFTSGEPDTAKVTGGAEGIAFGPDYDKDGYSDLYVSVVIDSRVHVYRGPNPFGDEGKFIAVVGSKTTLPDLSFPTGIATQPDIDLNGDGVEELFVASSGTDKILAFDVNPDSPTVNTVLLTITGNATNELDSPEGIKFANLDGEGAYELYASSYANRMGQVICRWSYDPSTRTFTESPSPNQPAGSAAWFRSTRFGIGYFDFSDSASTVSPVPTPTPTTPPGGKPAFETAGVAGLLTNYISSEQRFTDSELSGTTAEEDKAADLEPAFSRIKTSTSLAAQMIFSSGRRIAPAPNNNVADPSPLVVNPFGGPELNTDGTKVNPPYTHDLWTTVTVDITPPILVPQGSGDQQTPFIAPGQNAPYSYETPRTPEQGQLGGLQENSPVKIAFVLNEKQSGIDTTPGAITVSFRNAGDPQFGTPSAPEVISAVNENIPVAVQIEGEAAPVGNRQNLPVAVWDDGPLGQGGHERQGNAIAGDGEYFCESTVPQDGAIADLAPILTPEASGDYYIDLNVTDLRGNTFTYDNIWGFSTLEFQSTSGRDLFVSDYTIGQRFRFIDPVNKTGDYNGRHYAIVPTESYWLENNGGKVLDTDLVTVKALSVTTTFSPDSVDIWRTLCRGGLTESQFLAYRPGSENQIDPDPAAPSNNESGVEPYTKPSRKVTTSANCIIWAAPYAGEVMAGPGTIADPNMQELVKGYLELGGRVFLSSRSLLWATAGNKVGGGNTFTREELRANFAGEADATQLTSGPGSFQPVQFPINLVTGNSYRDASTSQDPSTLNRGPQFDIISPAGGTDGVSVAYTHNGQPVGQRIVTERGDGAESRMVFFSFNFDAMNRGYRQNNNPSLIPQDRRARTASAIRQYFKTSTISGRVFDVDGNLPVANFLLEVVGGGNKFFVRTDKDGSYYLQGLPDGVFDIRPATGAAIDVLPNRLYTTDEPLFGLIIPGGSTADLEPIYVTKVPQGSLRGYVVSSNGTPDNKADDEPLPNIQVLARAKDVSTGNNGGRYAQLARTVNPTSPLPGKSAAYFEMSNIPPTIEIELIFNPRLEDIPVESNLRNQFIERGGQNLNYGRRVIPDKKRPEAITVPQGTVVYVDELATGDTAANQNEPIVVPLGPTLSGIVTVRGTPVENFTVTLSRTDGVAVPAPDTTDVDGKYEFVDIRPGKYTVTVEGTFDGISVKRVVSFTVAQGTDFLSPAADIDIFLGRIYGVVKDGAGNIIPGANVVLRRTNGQDYVPTRTKKTNLNGRFGLLNIPAGTYIVFASSGSLSGSTLVTLDGKSDKDIEVTIKRTGIFGKVFVNGVASQGITVELLTSAGASFSPARTTTTDANGFYGFQNLTAGTTYRVRATYNFDSDIKTVTFSTDPTRAPDLNLVLSRVTGKVTAADGTAATGARVELVRNGVVIRSNTTDALGNLRFNNVGAGAYTIRAYLSTQFGKADFAVQRGVNAVVNVKLSASVGAGNPTTFTNNGRYYIISIPYQTANSPASNNANEPPATPATIAVRDAFDLLPVDPTTLTRNYILERLNPRTGAYESLDSGSAVLERGRGYRLKVVQGVVNMRLNRTPLEASQTRFRIKLQRNPSLLNNPNNGMNLIGFGINPKTFAAHSWKTARVILPNGKTYESPAAAAAEGVMEAGIFTLEPSGSTETTVYSNNLTPFAGYYAKTYVDGVVVVLRNATPAE